MFKYKQWFVLLVLAALSGGASAGPAENKANAIAFLKMVHQGPKEIDEAFAKYVGPRYVQHNPRVPDGIEGTKKWLKEFFAKGDPAKPRQYEIIKAAVDGDYVIVHSHSYPQGELGSALMDWLKFENGKIVEHWDVVQQVPDPATAANSNTMFGK